ncbi:hypothetical protein [Lacrimispora indolis]|uniref:hypothetical protein n=1 Tax=Lacrimispora indolis TaxID=69825 RepID=UPI0003F5A4F5|nr:hypothetical protein [[Clostridium] methoxybenzovorans]
MRKKVFKWIENLQNIDLSNYTHIKVYHTCRTLNIDSYIREGVHCFTKKEAYKEILEILLQCNISEKDILKCFNDHWNSGSDHFNCVYVNISKEELLNESGHYLVYGSEFVCGMASDLFCQHRLKRIGIPTLIECNIAIEKIPGEVRDFIEKNRYEDGAWDGGICLNSEIEPGEIVECIQPKKIYDPLMGIYDLLI